MRYFRTLGLMKPGVSDCWRNIPLDTHYRVLSVMTGFPAVFAMTLGARFLRSRSRPSNLFEPFLHTPALQFLIQNT
jgi:hypothetical protein